MGWEVGERFKREGTHVYLWLIHGDTWQKQAQHCKAIILQLKLNLRNPVINHNGKEYKKEYVCVCVCVTESLCCAAESTTTL